MSTHRVGFWIAFGATYLRYWLLAWIFPEMTR